MAVFSPSSLSDQIHAWINSDKDSIGGGIKPYQYLVLIAVTTLAVQYFLQSRSRLILVNGAALPWDRTKSKKRFMQNAADILKDGFMKAAGKPFRVLSEVGEIIILPPRYAYEIRNDERLSFTKAAFKWFYAHLPGFEGFREGTNESHIMKLVARHQLTHQLTLVTKAVSEECAAALEDVYTDNEDWHEITVKEANLRLMARITSRVFLGEKLCRDPEWLRITTTYTTVAFQAVEELRLWPEFLRPLAQWWLPKCSQARALVEEARGLVNPLLEERRIAKAKAKEEGRELVFNDAIEWLESTAKEHGSKYDPACAQLSLSVAAIHSTTDFFTQATLDIVRNRELIQPLREEIMSVIGQRDWTKQSLYHLKLMDSVLKESQRLKPIAIASMRRFTECEIKLSDGQILPKNHLTLVSSDRHWSPDAYPNPDTFDGYRFYNQRQVPGKENVSQLVTVSPEHMGFGFGLHACPGRFFASEEIKIAFCHIIMKYDMEVVEGSTMEPRRYALSLLSNPTAKLRIRRRKEEMQI